VQSRAPVEARHRVPSRVFKTDQGETYLGYMVSTGGYVSGKPKVRERDGAEVERGRQAREGGHVGRFPGCRLLSFVPEMCHTGRARAYQDRAAKHVRRRRGDPKSMVVF
jgi:hypothetical protein